MGPLYESMIPQGRRAGVAALIREAAPGCLARKQFYTYAAIHGLVAACDYLDAQKGTDRRAALALRDEIGDIIKGDQ